MKLIKFQPVRKCGKVDIYTKKRSIVGSILGNKITSNNHNLSTNDIIEISNALFDGTQNGVADKHPLNGTKYVRPIDDDTFEIYDDEFLKSPVLLTISEPQMVLLGRASLIILVLLVSLGIIMEVFFRPPGEMDTSP